MPSTKNVLNERLNHEVADSSLFIIISPKQHEDEIIGRTEARVFSKFLSSRFQPKSRRLFSFYFSNIMLPTDLLTFGVAAAVFRIACRMRRLSAYFDNPAGSSSCSMQAAIITMNDTLHTDTYLEIP